MVRVLRHYKPPAGSAVTRPSDALECPDCKCITWLWADQAWGRCRSCSLTFHNRDGKWYLRGERPPKKKEATPKE